MRMKSNLVSAALIATMTLGVSACHSKDKDAEAELAATKAEMLKLENARLKKEVEDLKEQVTQLKSEKKLALNQAKRQAAAPAKKPQKAAAPADEPLSPAEAEALEEQVTGGGSFK